MKKLLSIMVAIVVVFVSVFAVSASSNIYEDIPEKTEYQYFDLLKEYVEGYEIMCDYRELCHYSDENSAEPDWVLMLCQCEVEPWMVRFGALVGNRALYNVGGAGRAPGITGFRIYIPKSDTFIDLVNGNIEEIIELCPGFVETIEENEIGLSLGDINEDSAVDILDATYIQCALACMKAYPILGIRSGSESFTLADYDRDGKTTVMDATAIQMKLAQLEN